jgi:hypothetical protein
MQLERAQSVRKRLPEQNARGVDDSIMSALQVPVLFHSCSAASVADAISAPRSMLSCCDFPSSPYISSSGGNMPTMILCKFAPNWDA